jgi:hypothetical protein
MRDFEKKAIIERQCLVSAATEFKSAFSSLARIRTKGSWIRSVARD